MPSGIYPVPLGDVAFSIPGAFPSPPYVVNITPSWSTECPVTGKTTLAITGDLSVPAPAGAELNWTVTAISTSPPPPAGVGTTLQAYLDELNDLLHDPLSQYWGQMLPTQKIKYINRGLRQRDVDTSANRVLQSLVLTTGQDTYGFSLLPNPSIFDVVSINLLNVGQRIVLDQASMVDLTAGLRSWLPYTDYPAAWARYGQNTVVFAPAPSLAFLTEWDTCVVSADLVLPTDQDPLGYPFTTPVPYWAAYLAKINERQYQEAERFLALYRQQILNCLGARTGLVPTVYPARVGRR